MIILSSFKEKYVHIFKIFILISFGIIHAQQNDSLQVALSTVKRRTRMDRGSSHCLNLLLAERLVSQGYRMTMPVADEMSQTLRFLIPQKQKRRRPTRRFVLSWSEGASGNSQRSLSSVTLQLGVTQVESVFGQAFESQSVYNIEMRFTPSAPTGTPFLFNPHLIPV